MFDWIKYKYWNIVPYDWRPFQIWYRLKCRLWKRYTVIKPRYLPYTWCDRTEVLPHMMFEILSQFIEQECSPGIVDWEASGHMITVNGKLVNVRDEMQDLYDWWHKVYQITYQEAEDLLWKEAYKHDPIEHDEEEDFDGQTVYRLVQDFTTPEDEEIYHRCLMGCNKLETIQRKELEKRMHRLVRLTPYLWT